METTATESQAQRDNAGVEAGGITCSSKQIAANRLNAQKSTGPKSPEGRASSKMNALKHGIRSRNVLVSGLNIQEDEEEFTAFQDRFHEELDPVGPLEEMLVDSIVSTQWRLQRVLKAESGEIALSVDAKNDSADSDESRVSDFMIWKLLPDPVKVMKTSTKGLVVLMKNLAGVQGTFQRDGKLSKKTTDEVLINDNQNMYSLRLAEFQARFEKNPDKKKSGARAAHRKEVIDYLKGEIDELKEMYLDLKGEEWIKEESDKAARTLPSGEVLEKIMRYEVRLERQLYRAMGQLERLQRIRRGEAVPPPLKVDLTGKI